MRKLWMIKYYLIVISTFFAAMTGCEKEYTNIISPETPLYQVTDVSNLKSFTRTEIDSIITLYIKIDNPAVVAGVSVVLQNPDNKTVPGFPASLRDNGNIANGDMTEGDGIFTNKFVLSKNYVNGTYSIDYNILLNNGTAKKVISQSFHYNNGQSNIAPVISNLVAPDTLVVSDTTLILLSIAATDSNGMSDIEKVYFISYRPDGTTSGVAFQLYDTGRDGDATANDGIYSGIISVFPSNQKGTYRFEFQAIDRGKKVSNTITHRITLL